MSTSYPLSKIKAVLLEGPHPRGCARLEQAGYRVETHPDAKSLADLLTAAGDAHLLGIRSKTQLPRAFFESADKLLAVGCFCIGTNQVDLEAAAEHGVAVFNAPFSNTRSVAEKTLCEIIALHRRLFERSSHMHAGRWMKSAHGSHEVRGRTLGIVGYGRIGSQVSVLAESLGMRVLFYDVRDCLALGNATRSASLDALLEESDAVTLHVPATAATRGMIGRAHIARMKSGALLLNNARGDVVDLDALGDAIRDGHLSGAALDVFPKEPASNDEAFVSPLVGMANVILTPHVGGSTIEAQQNIAEEVASKLITLTNNGSTTTSVNVPEVELPALHPDHHRILHFHRNVPGVLSTMHRIMADLGVNIAAEYLQSDQLRSSVILDIEPTHSDAIRDGLLAMAETIRVRVLW